MLAGALFYVALIALIAATILSAGLSMTRVAIARMAQPYLATGYQRAETSLQQTIAAQMRSTGVPYPAPAFTPIPPACANAACTYTTRETIAITQLSRATPGPACDPSQSSCAPNVQANGYVGESRLTASITVFVNDANGHAVATRTSAIVLRTLDAPPYVLPAGMRESAFDDVSAAAAAGDDGGAPPATPNPCAPAPAGDASDTVIRVAYHDDQNGTCSDGSAWANASYSASSSASGWSP